MIDNTQDDIAKCSIRQGPSFHVEYILNEMDGWETANLTHAETTPDDDWGESDIEVGWVLEDDESPNFAILHIFEDSEQTTFHRLSTPTLFQLADAFRLAALRCQEREADDLEKQRTEEAAQLVEDIEIARMYQPLPFSGDTEVSR